MRSWCYSNKKRALDFFRQIAILISNIFSESKPEITELYKALKKEHDEAEDNTSEASVNDEHEIVDMTFITDLLQNVVQIAESKKILYDRIKFKIDKYGIVLYSDYTYDAVNIQESTIEPFEIGIGIFIQTEFRIWDPCRMEWKYGIFLEHSGIIFKNTTISWTWSQD